MPSENCLVRQVFLGKFRGRGPVPVGNLPPIAPAPQCPATSLPSSGAAPQQDGSPAAAASAATAEGAPFHQAYMKCDRDFFEASRELTHKCVNVKQTPKSI